ncbi:GNAT family N-acetyltransferase, partial [bacterium]|nr:GNAT family N-acetyltransferase [bacterium]
MKIRYLNIFDITKLKKLTSHLNNDDVLNFKADFVFNPLSIINNILPSKYKFLQDSYVIIKNNDIKGMITLKPKNNNPQKWIIKKLFLEENFIEAGENLINYVVEKYAEKGVETFEADINSDNSPIIDLFSKACGFRYCLDFQIYEIKTCYYKNKVINAENFIFRPMKPEDRKELSELYNQNISPYYKFSLSKIPEEYSENFFK